MIEPLASRLRTARTERGLSQEEVARALGVSRQSVSKWERGEALPSRANRQALAALYGLSPPRRKGDGEGGGPTGDSGAVCSRFLRLSTSFIPIWRLTHSLKGGQSQVRRLNSHHMCMYRSFPVCLGVSFHGVLAR